ncbi:MAG: hypothetical protein PHE54_04565 [Bacilli bacterium]|nr:hypothetical protein [Bacilli bacterium]
MKRKYWYILFLLVMLFPLNIRASYYCDYSEKAKLKKLAANINTIYTPVISGDKATFNITINNIFDNLIVKDTSSGISYQGNEEITIKGYAGGISYLFEVYTDIEDCEDELLHVFYVNVPYYNPYYQDELCDGIEEYSMCQKWMSYKVDYEKFKTNIAIYKKTSEEEIIDEVVDEETWLDILLEYYGEYYSYLYGMIIIIGIFEIYRLDKRDSFNL